VAEGAQETTDAREALREQVVAMLVLRRVTWRQIALSPAEAKGLADAVLDVVAPALAAAEQRGREQGWDEGYRQGVTDHCDAYDCDISCPNPYRAASPAPTEESDPLDVEAVAKRALTEGRVTPDELHRYAERGVPLPGPAPAEEGDLRG